MAVSSMSLPPSACERPQRVVMLSRSAPLGQVVNIIPSGLNMRCTIFDLNASLNSATVRHSLAPRESFH